MLSRNFGFSRNGTRTMHGLNITERKKYGDTDVGDTERPAEPWGIITAIDLRIYSRLRH